MPLEPQTTGPTSLAPDLRLQHLATPPGDGGPQRPPQAWLRLVVARQVLARCTGLIEEWRRLRSVRRSLPGQRRNRWRRLASAAAGLLL
ncbi:MAG: hypothetical protein DYG90_11780, partial [Chloroflexi bacterium CFX6]|nr:hypothetical protein [Chloroflexi bacterium CFX6]